VDLIDWFHDHYFGSAWPCSDPRAMPLVYENFDQLPPTLIISAGIDPLRDEASEYADKLVAANIPVTHTCEEGTIHGFMNMGRILRTVHSRSRREIAIFLRNTLQPSIVHKTQSVIDLQTRRAEARYS